MARRSHARGRRTHVGLEQRFVAAVREAHIEQGMPVIVGFSGGSDSLALALLFARTAPKTHIRPQLLHINHNLREGSADEAKFAESLASEIGLPFNCVDLEPGILERHSGVGLEEAARRERYLALSEFAKHHGTAMIAAGHHQRDQAETVLLHLLHGAGISGISGMAKMTSLEVPWWPADYAISQIQLWRPLLYENPEELKEYVLLSALIPIHDPSNDEPDFLRNAIRHKVLPVLEDIQSGATKSIARYAMAAWSEDQYLERLAREMARGLRTSHHRINRPRAKATEPVLFRRILKIALAEAGVENVTFERIAAVAELVSEEAGNRVIELESNCIAIADVDWLYFGQMETVWREFSEVNGILIAPDCLVDEILDMPEIGQTLKFGAFSMQTHEFPGTNETLTFQVRRTAFDEKPVLRVIKPGDRWAVSGRSVTEWLRSQGVPPVARRRLMAVASPRGVWTIPTVVHPSEDDPCADRSQSAVFLQIQMPRSGDQE